MKKFTLILMVPLLFISTFPANASAHMGGGGLIGAIIVPPMYRNESAFTQVPAGAGGLILTLPALVVGGAAHITGYTIGIPFGKEDAFAEKSAVYSGIGTIWLGATVTGTPFFIAEKTLYDAPRALFSVKGKSSANNTW